MLSDLTDREWGAAETCLLVAEREPNEDNVVALLVDGTYRAGIFERLFANDYGYATVMCWQELPVRLLPGPYRDRIEMRDLIATTTRKDK
jgi:hypothetical protein